MSVAMGYQIGLRDNGDATSFGCKTNQAQFPFQEKFLFFSFTYFFDFHPDQSTPLLLVRPSHGPLGTNTP